MLDAKVLEGRREWKLAWKATPPETKSRIKQAVAFGSRLTIDTEAALAVGYAQRFLRLIPFGVLLGPLVAGLRTRSARACIEINLALARQAANR